MANEKERIRDYVNRLLSEMKYSEESNHES